MIARLRQAVGVLAGRGSEPRRAVSSRPQFVVLEPSGRMRVLSRYEAGQVTRRDPDFIPRGLGVNALAEQGLDLAVRRSRDLVDNNELVDGAIKSRVNNVVGIGIDDLEPDTGYPDLDEQLAELIEWAARRVDTQRNRSLADDQRLFQRELDIAGTVLVHYPTVKAWRGYPAMPAIELIEFERLPLDLAGVVPKGKEGAGHEVRQGIEFDDDGAVAAYHVLRFHPKDGGWGSFGASWGAGSFGGSLGGDDLVRIPVENAELVHEWRRIGQLRGLPQAISVMGTIRTEQQFQEVCIDQARIAASLGLFFETPDDRLFKQPDGSYALMVDAMGNPVMRIEGSTVGFVRPNGGLKIAAATLPGPTFESTGKVLQRRTSRGLGLPYSTYSGDASDTSYASMRGEKLDARSGYLPLQRLVFERHTEPWRRRVIMWGILTRLIVLSPEQVRRFSGPIGLERLFKVTPGYPAAGYIDPKAESTARATDIGVGVRSPIDAVQEDGRNWKRVIAERVKFAQRLKVEMEKAGITAADLAVATSSGKSSGGSGDTGTGQDSGATEGDGGQDGQGGGGDGEDAEKDTNEGSDA